MFARIDARRHGGEHGRTHGPDHGGNTGLGEETAVVLAREGALVVFTTRDAQKGATALTEIPASWPASSLAVAT